jgi:hypothetical protein
MLRRGDTSPLSSGLGSSSVWSGSWIQCGKGSEKYALKKKKFPDEWFTSKD